MNDMNIEQLAHRSNVRCCVCVHVLQQFLLALLLEELLRYLFVNTE